MFVRKLGCLEAARSRLLGALDQLFHAPALFAGKGACFDDQHAVARFVLVLLIVSLVLLPARHELAVLRVRQPPLDGHDARLLHLVAGHDTHQFAATRGRAATGFFRLLVCVGHDYFSLLARVALPDLPAGAAFGDFETGAVSAFALATGAAPPAAR